MPIVRIEQTPPIPEGEYSGILTKVSSGFTQKTNEQRFTYNIRMKDGRVIRDSLYFGEKVAWRIAQLVKSADLIPPENSEAGFVLTTDDLEGRVVHFAVKHNQGENGRIFQNVNYHTMGYAIQQNPTLAGMYPPQTPRHLRAAPPEELPPESGEQTTAPVTPPPSVTSTSSVAGPGVAEVDDDTLTPEEFAQILEQRKKNRAKPGNQAA
jgi:hypothetical protein